MQRNVLRSPQSMVNYAVNICRMAGHIQLWHTGLCKCGTLGYATVTLKAMQLWQQGYAATWLLVEHYMT